MGSGLEVQGAMTPPALRPETEDTEGAKQDDTYLERRGGGPMQRRNSWTVSK